MDEFVRWAVVLAYGVIYIVCTALVVYALATGKIKLKRRLYSRQKSPLDYWRTVAVVAVASGGSLYFLIQALRRAL